MREEFEKMAAAGKLERHLIPALVQLTDTGFCLHRSWGFGRIKTLDPVFARFTIDFDNKPDHSMDLAFAAESLKPIPKDHILARKASELENLRKMAATQHLELVKLVLTSLDGKATVEQIQKALVPEIVTSDWPKWWETARRELKKDGHFHVPLKKSEPIIYEDEEISPQQRLMTAFRTAKGLKAHSSTALEVIKNVDDLTDPAAAGAEIVALLNTEIASHLRTQPAVALEAIFVRDDVRAAIGLQPAAEESTPQTVWAQASEPGLLLEQLPNARRRRALESFKTNFPDRWLDVLQLALNTVSARTCGELAGFLIQNNHLEELKETLARLISQHSASSELLLWLAKERNDSFADILGPEVFRAMLTALERDQFNERRSNRLRDFIVDDPSLLLELISSADFEVIKDLTRALQLSPSFDDMDKRSLLARIVKSYPTMQSLISGEPTRQESTLVVSWESLERRKHEYHELVQKKIPANSREIAIARSYGDLSENHEYKAAKEMQKLLLRRKADLEAELVRARGTDFVGVRTDIAGAGTVVYATDLATNQSERFTILGAWDSDPERNIVSYLSPVAQALIGHKVGDEVEFEVHQVAHRHRLDAIEPYKTEEPSPA